MLFRSKDETPKEPEAQEKPDEPSTEDTRPKVEEKYVKALKRDGWSDEDIAALKPERVKELGERRIKNHTDIDGSYQRLKELENKIAQMGKPTDDGQKMLSLEDALKSYEDQYGPELAAGLKPIVEALRRQENERLAKLEESMSEYKANAQEREIESLRKSQTSDWPDLDSDEKYDAVRKAMVDLDRAGIYKTIPDLFNAACRLTMSVTAKDVQARLTKHAEARRLGQPHDGVKNNKSPARTPDEKNAEAFRRLEAKHGMDR